MEKSDCIFAGLIERYAHIPQVSFHKTSSGLIFLEIESEACYAKLFLQGAHVVSFAPKNQRELLWLSPLAEFQIGKAIRGGVPICWPWFGKHSTKAEFPQHGIARTSYFKIKSILLNLDGSIEMSMMLDNTSFNKSFWPFNTTLQVRFKFSQELSISLTTLNLDVETLPINQAIHTYFSIDDITKSGIKGLKDANYLDQLTLINNPEEKELVTIDEEIDRIYSTQNSALELRHLINLEAVSIQQHNANHVVVWNPWISKAKLLKDFPDDGYLTMLCIESANLQDSVILSPSEEFNLSQSIRLIAD